MNILHEAEIIWLRDPKLYDYLREGEVPCAHREAGPTN